MPPEAKALYNELTPLIIGMQYVRNATIHGVFVDFLADEPFWHLRSKNRELTEAQLVSCEELINYTAHVAEAFRISLGGKEAERDPLPPKDDPGRFGFSPALVGGLVNSARKSPGANRGSVMVGNLNA